MSQLVLPIRLGDHAVFETFHPAGNEIAVEYLRSLPDNERNHGAWIWGAPATGKTHLLQALCERYGDRAVYVPIRNHSHASADILEGLASRDLVCIDDIHLVCGRVAWERALFALLNTIFDNGHQLPG